MGYTPQIFLYFRLFQKQLTVNNGSIKVANDRSSGIGSDRAVKCATATAQDITLYINAHNQDEYYERSTRFTSIDF